MKSNDPSLSLGDSDEINTVAPPSSLPVLTSTEYEAVGERGMGLIGELGAEILLVEPTWTPGRSWSTLTPVSLAFSLW